MTDKTLGELYEEREELSFNEWKTQRDIKRREVVLIPKDSKGTYAWPGKNDAQRDIARDKACISDEAMKCLMEQLSDIKKELSKVNGLIANLEGERRKREWDVRREQVAVLRELAVQRNTRAPEGSDIHLFDDVMQSEADREISEEIERRYHDAANGLHHESDGTESGEIPF